MASGFEGGRKEEAGAGFVGRAAQTQQTDRAYRPCRLTQSLVRG